MPVDPCLIPPISEQQYPIRGQVCKRRGFPGRLQKRLLRKKGLCARILQLLGQILGHVGRVGRTGDAAGPVDAKVYDGDVNVVGRVQAHDIALLPVEDMAEALAEFVGEMLDLVERVSPASVAVEEEGWNIVLAVRHNDNPAVA